MRVFWLQRFANRSGGVDSYFIVTASLFAFLAFTVPALAQLPAARINTLFPPGAKAGTTIDLTASGVDLDGATELRFTSPGISAKSADSSDSETDHKFSVTISSDALPGSYEARVIGRFGISNSRVFVVGDRPEMLQQSGKSGRTPMNIPLDTIINGCCSVNSTDSYFIELKQGQRVLIECTGHEIDSKLSPVMSLADAQGTELARSRRGGLIDFTAPANAAYTLELHDLLYKGGPEYFYRLSVSTGPHLDSIFPPAGLPGSKGKYTLLGRNLPGATLTNLRAADGSPLERLDVEIELPADASAAPRDDALALLGPAGAGVDGVAWRLKSDKGISNPVLIGFAGAPLVIGPDAGESDDHLQKLAAPCEVAGRFYPHGKHDVYTFDAEKGEIYWIEILSARLGQPTSPELLVQRVGKTDKGDERVSDVQDMGGPDMQPVGKRGGGASAGFPAPSRDVEYRLDARDGGTYRLTVSDLFDETQDNATLIYRMLIHKQAPDFRLVATTAAPPPRDGTNFREPAVSPPFLRKGGITVIHVNELRENGFDGEVTVEAQGLPPGVRCAPAIISPEENGTNLFLLADENAAAWAGEIHVVGKTRVGDSDKTCQARIGTIVWPTLNPGNANVERAQARLSADMPLVVSSDETEAISLDIGDGNFEAKADATIRVPVKVNRRIELKQPLKIVPVGLPRPNNDNNKPDLTIESDADSGTLELDLTRQRFAPGTYTFYLQAQVSMKYDRTVGVIEKPVEGGKSMKRQGVDSLVTFYSPPIVLKILPNNHEHSQAK